MAITTVKKSKLGYEDILFDALGTGATTETLKSDGTYRTVQKVNASHLPITSTARAKKFADGTTVSTTDVDATLIQILDDLEDLGQPDGTTLEVSAGALKVKAIAAAQLGTDAVETAKIKAANVTNAKLAVQEAVQGSGSGATGVNVIKAKSIDTAELDDGAITNDKVAAGSIKAAKLLDTPTHYIFTAGTYSLSCSAETGVATIAGLQDTDIVLVTPVVTGANYAVKYANHSGTTLAVVFTGAIVSATIYAVVYRAVTA